MKYKRVLIRRARELRKDMTFEERKLWYRFLSGFSFRFQRQKVISGFITDFYCHDARLAIEIDGSQHFTEQGLVYDQERSDVLMKQGIDVIRFTNVEIQNEFESVCEVIKEYCINNTRSEARSATPPVTFGDIPVKQDAQIYDLVHIAYAGTAKEGD